MKKIKQLLLIILLTFGCVRAFSQTVDSLSIYPNPFSISTTIHFDIEKSDTITLNVYDRMGRILKNIFQSTILPSGSYNLNMLGDSLEDGIYYIRLDIGSTKTIAKAVVKNSLISGIADNKTIDNIVIFPNPTNESITIPIVGNKTIIIADLSGKILKSFTTSLQTISLLDIATGQYLITILTNQNEKLTTQIILKRE